MTDSMSGTGSSRRNPKRRQRTHSDDGGGNSQQPRAKRQRAGLRANTYDKPGNDEANGTTHGEGEETQGANGSLSVHGHDLRHRDRAGSSEIRDLPVRPASKKSSGGSGDHRANAGDGSIELTRNDRYAVTKLPSLPDAIRKNLHDNIQGHADADSSYALVTTRTHAFVWPHRSTISSPETFVFTLPEPAKKTTDPLPLAALVHGSTPSVEPGLVVIVPTTGKITYWESISSAAVLDTIRQQRRGIEGSTNSMLSGETVAQVVSLEPAGFVLRFSTGRLALLNTRDAQGRPVVNVQPLRGKSAAGSGGLFGGLKTVFGGGGWRRDVVAVAAGPPSKRTDRDFVVATSTGVLQLWNAHRGGQYEQLEEVDCRHDLASALKRQDTSDLASKTEEEFELLDATVLSHQRKEKTESQEASNETKMLVLGAFHGQISSAYGLIEVITRRDAATVERVHLIKCFTHPVESTSKWKPRVMVPKPHHMAFVVFERAIVLTALVTKPDRVDEQILLDTKTPLSQFEDVIDFRDDMDLQVVGCAQEDSTTNAQSRRKPKEPACTLMVRGSGLMRITAFKKDEDFPRGLPPEDFIRGKIEQAIYFGTDATNPLMFTAQPNTSIDLADVVLAALDVSNAILTSSSPYLSTVIPSQDQQLKKRADLQDALVKHLRAVYPPLDKKVMWRLLGDAEKIAGARAIWKLYGVELSRPRPKGEMTVLARLVEMIHEDMKTDPDDKMGETDFVRFWLTKDVDKMRVLLAWTHRVISELAFEGKKDPSSQLRFVSEANDICLGGLETAFAFRQENLEKYGLEDGIVMHGGILWEGWQGLNRFWTTEDLVVGATHDLLDLAQNLAIEFSRKAPEELSQADSDRLELIKSQMHRQVKACSGLYRETSEYHLADEHDAERMSRGRQFKTKALAARSTQIRKVAELGLVDEAIELAERFFDMETLVKLMAGEMHDLTVHLSEPGISEDDRIELDARLQDFTDKVQYFFDRYGERWADALFEQQIRSGKLSELLQDVHDQQEHLTTFLRKRPEFAKLCWINDVAGEKDFDAAADTILKQANVREKDLWAKKVELSIGKLAKLAVREGIKEDTGNETDHIKWIDTELTLIHTQEMLYELIMPHVMAALDESAGVSLAMEAFGTQVSKDKPALRSILEAGISALISREYLGASRIIDVLTLMDHSYKLNGEGEPDEDDDDDVVGREFFLAFQTLQNSGIKDQQQRELLQKLIWRRCMIRDDWVVVNDTQLKDDQAVEQSTGHTALFSNLKAAFKAGIFSPTSQMRPIKPADVLGAGCEPSDLKDGVPEDLQAAVAADLHEEDDILRTYIDQGRLDEWFDGIVEAVQSSITRDAKLQQDLTAEKAKIGNNLHHFKAVSQERNGEVIGLI